MAKKIFNTGNTVILQVMTINNEGWLVFELLDKMDYDLMLAMEV